MISVPLHGCTCTPSNDESCVLSGLERGQAGTISNRLPRVKKEKKKKSPLCSISAWSLRPLAVTAGSLLRLRSGGQQQGSLTRPLTPLPHAPSAPRLPTHTCLPGGGFLSLDLQGEGLLRRRKMGAGQTSTEGVT